MACDCDKYIDCKDGSMEVAAPSSTSDAYGHTVNNNFLLDGILEFSEKTVRAFSVTYAWDRDVTPEYRLTGCGGSEPIVPCGGLVTAISASSCSENCVREKNIPYYWDRQRGIYVWKHVRESLSFSISSNKTAAFKMKWGPGAFHKICIPNSVRTSGKEQFIMVKDGVKTILAEVEYTYNPFPMTESGGATWGLYGNTVQRTANPDTADVACILLFPTVPKQAIALDNDVIAYGFYDYNAVEGGFVESSLPKDDGGKDYFYPYWCRSMPIDPLWRSVADKRYEVIYSKGTMDLAGATEWKPSEPTVYPFPFGSFAMDSKENFIASCILQFGERSGGKGVIYNESSIGDLFEALTKAKVSLRGPYTALHPVTPL